MCSETSGCAAGPAWPRRCPGPITSWPVGEFKGSHLEVKPDSESPASGRALKDPVRLEIVYPGISGFRLCLHIFKQILSEIFKYHDVLPLRDFILLMLPLIYNFNVIMLN
jgi:hypothetical protein